jgi:hypothetical protein
MKILLSLLFSISALASETVIIPGTTSSPGAATHMYLQTNTNHLAPAQVCYTSDGNGHVVPITGGANSQNPINPNGTLADSTSIGSGAATAFTAPANAIGFLIEASSSNTENLRWAVGATATPTSGMRLEPGRDSGYMPVGASISVIAEAGSGQEASVQWILNQ